LKMKGLFYNFLLLLTRIFGTWIFTLIARGIATGYFLFFPARVAVSIRFYRMLFPDRARWYHIWCSLQQYHNFTRIFLDRYTLCKFHNITYTYEGWEHLETALSAGSGAVILQSHLGNWEVAAHLMKLKNPAIRLLLYMGAKAKEEIEQIQKIDFTIGGIEVLAVDKDNGSPFDILEGVRHIESGGVVAMTGDKLWRSDQRAVTVTFCGRQVRVPEAPYLLALLAKAPLFLFFSFNIGKSRHHFTLSESIAVAPVSRKERARAVQQAAQQYADLLEASTRRYPLQWYHFESFI